VPRPVVAGPVEATALGNLLVQPRTQGVIQGDLAALLERIRRTAALTRYEPRSG
jgi:rhamnulokinase